MPTLDKIFEVSSSFYDELHKQAKPEEVNGEQTPVFRGSMTKVWHQVSNSQSYYVPVQDFLRSYGYMTILQRGSRGKDSVIVFHGRPNRADLDGLDLTALSEPAKLKAEIEEIQKRLGGIDIVEAFANVEGRLKELETLVQREEVNGKNKKATKPRTTTKES
jgi:hypothetical protein